MEEKNSKNIYQKLAAARYRLRNIEMKKSGQNDYKDFQYAELADFLPNIIDVENELGMLSVITYEEEKACLTLYNLDNVFDENERLTFTFDIAAPNVSGASAIQQNGAIHTYARRYLYIDAYNIVVKDEVDAETGRQGVPQQRNRQPVQPDKQYHPAPKFKPASACVDPETGEVRSAKSANSGGGKNRYVQILEAIKGTKLTPIDIGKFCMDSFGINKFNELTDDQFEEVMKQIAEFKERN